MEVNIDTPIGICNHFTVENQQEVHAHIATDQRSAITVLIGNARNLGRPPKKTERIIFKNFTMSPYMSQS